MPGFRLKSGEFVVPYAIHDEKTGMVGDMLIKIDKTDPQYQAWVPHVVEAPPDVEAEYANKKVTRSDS